MRTGAPEEETAGWVKEGGGNQVGIEGMRGGSGGRV